MPDILADVPASITAGSSYLWAVSIEGHDPSTGSVLSYSFYNGSNQYTLTATDNGDGQFLTTLNSTTSATYAAGAYHWQAFVTKSGEREDAGSGELTIKPDPAAGAVDGRSIIKQTLDAINQTLLGVASKQNEVYSVDGVSVTKMNKADLIAAKKQYEIWYQQEKDAERMAKGLGRRSKVRVRL